MRKNFLGWAIAIFAIIAPAKADFGDADFPVGLFSDSPKSYHDGFCRTLKNKCRIHFQGPAMWVEGQGGIQANQYIRYRHDKEGKKLYNYIYYKSKTGKERVALFLFRTKDYRAEQDFIRAFLRWKDQKSLTK